MLSHAEEKWMFLRSIVLRSYLLCLIFYSAFVFNLEALAFYFPNAEFRSIVDFFFCYEEFAFSCRFKRLTGRNEVAVSARDYKFYSPRHKYRRVSSSSVSNIPGLPVSSHHLFNKLMIFTNKKQNPLLTLFYSLTFI